MEIYKVMSQHCVFSNQALLGNKTRCNNTVGQQRGGWAGEGMRMGDVLEWVAEMVLTCTSSPTPLREDDFACILLYLKL